MTLAVLVDLSGSFVPRDLGDGPVAMLYVGIRRAVLFGFVPLAVVLVVFAIARHATVSRLAIGASA